MASHPVRFYFSFRSPYSWLAFERLARLRPANIAWSFVPTWPRPGRDGKVHDPVAAPGKREYVVHDVLRQATALGLAMQPPRAMDCAWARPHAAFLYGEAQGRPFETALALFRARWQDRATLDEDAVLRAAAIAADLDPDAFVAAADAPAGQEELTQRLRHARDDGLMGVPFLVLEQQDRSRGRQSFFGNDRIEWLLREIAVADGEPVPDLGADPFAPPWRAGTGTGDAAVP